MTELPVAADERGRRTLAGARYKVKSLGRALDLLDVLAGRGGSGMSLTELARALDISKPTAYAILQTYLARGLISDSGEGNQRRYRLGLALAKLGDVAIGSFGLVDAAMEELRRLTEELQMTSRVAILDDGHAVVVGRIDGPGAVRFDAALGRRELPHCSAVGKALLAQMPREEAKAILRRLGMPRRTAHTVTSIPAFLGELDRVAREGYAVDDEEDTEGVSCVAACVFDRGGKAAGAISVTGLKPRDWSRRRNLLAQAVKTCAARISQRLGAVAS
ncbi:MAG TPA: IclR family transcriptional regulator [Verrucomicrobiae bacterium]|nr:IclR family transcriptional regulator [Verrucomicrobiae bacterium]